MEEKNTIQTSLLTTKTQTPEDKYNIAYIIHFTSGTGYLLPWNAFITAVDYFQYLYPNRSIDRTFSVACQPVMLVSLVLIIFFIMPRSSARVWVNLGLGLFSLSMIVVPCLDVVYVKGRSGVNGGYYLTVGAVVVSGLANAFVQGGLIGSAAQLPHRFMQVVVAGTAASGVLVSALRIFTKAVYPQDYDGLRSSAILYFVVGIVFMMICLIFYNVTHRLPVIKHYNELKVQALEENEDEKGFLSGPVWEIMGRIKWHGIGIVVNYIVTLSIFPGFITEDVHSAVLGDWYATLLITTFNVFDLVGKALTAVYLVENANIAIGACFARLLFYPLYLGCLHGPAFFRTEIPVTVLTCVLMTGT